METRTLKEKIKKKFGTYSRFTRLAGIDRYEFQKNFLMQETVKASYHKEINGLYKTINDDRVNSKELLDVKKAIISEYGTIKNFTKKHNLKTRDVYQFVSGRLVGSDELYARIKEVLK